MLMSCNDCMLYRSASRQQRNLPELPVEVIYTITELFVREEMIRSFYSQLYNVTLPGNVPLLSDTLLGKTGNHCLWSLAKVVMFMGLLF